MCWGVFTAQNVVSFAECSMWAWENGVFYWSLCSSAPGKLDSLCSLFCPWEPWFALCPPLSYGSQRSGWFFSVFSLSLVLRKKSLFPCSLHVEASPFAFMCLQSPFSWHVSWVQYMWAHGAFIYRTSFPKQLRRMCLDVSFCTKTHFLLHYILYIFTVILNYKCTKITATCFLSTCYPPQRYRLVKREKIYIEIYTHWVPSLSHTMIDKEIHWQRWIKKQVHRELIP